MVINILSAAQESTAVCFSRPDLYPEPFEEGELGIGYTLSEEGLPVLEGSLGALSCRLVAEGSWPLHDLDSGFHDKMTGEMGASGSGAVASSELFLARVVRVERLPQPLANTAGDDSNEDLRTLPLLYHRRGYVTTSSIHIPLSKSRS